MSIKPFLPYAFFNGEIIPFENATVSVATHGLQYGSAVFGGIRGYISDNGAINIFRLPSHLQRLHNSANLIDITISQSVSELEKVVTELVKRNAPDSDIYIRPFAYKSGLNLPPGMRNVADGIAIYMAQLGRLHSSKDPGLKLKVSTWRRIDDTMIPPRGKISGAYVNSSLAKDEANRAGFDDAILLNSNGTVAEVSTCNLFIVRNGEIITPPASDNILEGITRHSLMQVAKDLGLPVVERSINRSELFVADEVFVTGTAVELDWVKQIDQKSIADGQPGPIFTQLQNQFSAIIRSQNSQYQQWLTKVELA